MLLALRPVRHGSRLLTPDRNVGRRAVGDAIVTPWEVRGQVDYNKLLRDFGCKPLDSEILRNVEELIGQPLHPLVKRGIFFSHRDLPEVLQSWRAGKGLYLYTGRGPSSSSMHVGHLVPFMVCQWLQRVLKVPVVVQLTDDEKFLWKNLDLDTVRHYTRENARDIIAMNFDPARTFIFSNLDYMGTLYPTVLQLQRHISASSARNTFGLVDSDSVGKLAFAAVQGAPAFSCAFPHLFARYKEAVPCLIPCAVDQDPYFRIARDVAPRLGLPKPALIHSTFFPALQGPDSKMSSSNELSAIFLTDTSQQIADKIMKHAFTGGQPTMKLHRLHGANVDIDVPFQYLRFFLHDDERFEQIRKVSPPDYLAELVQDYSSGKLLSKEVKEIAIEVLSELVERHQATRAKVSDKMVDYFMQSRPIPENEQD